MKRTKKNRKAEAEFFWKMDYEGGFWDAVLGYGLDPADYDLDATTKAELVSILELTVEIQKRVDPILRRFEESSEEFASDA